MPRSAFAGSFLFDAGIFLVSGLLVIALPRAAIEAPAASRTPPWHGLGAMRGRAPLRESLLLALQVNMAGAFVLVATVDCVKSELALPDRYYAWAMAIYDVGSVCGAIAYSRGGTAFRHGLVIFGAPAMIPVLALAGNFHFFPILLVAWAVIGAVQSLLVIRGSELLAANSNKKERAHIYAASPVVRSWLLLAGEVKPVHFRIGGASDQHSVTKRNLRSGFVRRIPSFAALRS